jgi:hypothetical protein
MNRHEKATSKLVSRRLGCFPLQPKRGARAECSSALGSSLGLRTGKHSGRSSRTR